MAFYRRRYYRRRYYKRRSYRRRYRRTYRRTYRRGYRTTNNRAALYRLSRTRYGKRLIGRVYWRNIYRYANRLSRGIARYGQSKKAFRVYSNIKRGGLRILNKFANSQDYYAKRHPLDSESAVMDSVGGGASQSDLSE